MTAPRVDPAGRPIGRRLAQALWSLGIVALWVALAVAIFRLTRGAPPERPAEAMAAVALAFWLATEAIGGRHGPVWPASALGITGAISAGFAASMAGPALRSAPPAEAMAVVSGTAALVMGLWLFRFRLPGLVSPVVTFAIVAVFLAVIGTDREGLAQVEGFSARGILAALIATPAAAASAGALGLAAAVLARRLDLKGDEFGLASARPLHLIGCGVAALVAGRALAALPGPADAAALMALALAGTAWALRINRFAVMVAVQLALARPLVTALSPDTTLDPQGWAVLLTAVLAIDLAAWPLLHHVWLSRGWTLGPGARIPEPRPGLWWRYWPYA